ncbi:MAG: glycerol-3-phosphate dehydrogenase/oxidase, partial [Arenicellales bacterium]
DIGSGTSANSLKTIHGGLRALQRLDFREMREYIRERRALMRIAPHLVTPMPCIMPTYRSLSQSKLFTGIGLKLYDFIAFDRNRELDESHAIPSCSIITRNHLNRLAPNLDRTASTGGACWIDGQVYNSERLTLSFVMSAVEAGADVFNHVEKTAYVTERGKISGVTARDRLTGETLNFNAGAVVDCTGPWAVQDDRFRESTQSKGPEIMARAVNLVCKRKLSDCALGVRARSGKGDAQRLLFVAPWRTGSIVGTWYYPETTLPDRLTVSRSEVADCLDQINSVFPSLKIDYDDISLVHIGMQPAHRGKGSDGEPDVWRHSRILTPDARAGLDGLYWVQGVKLTTARATAVEVINRVTRNLGKSIKPSSTHETPLYGANFRSYEQYRQDCITRLKDRLPEAVILRLLANYGSNTDLIMELVEQDPSLGEPVPGTADTIKAELQYVLGKEMPVTLSDLVLRRTDIGSFTCPGRDTLEFCAEMMARHAGWHEDERRRNMDELLQHYPDWQCSGD